MPKAAKGDIEPRTQVRKKTLYDTNIGDGSYYITLAKNQDYICATTGTRFDSSYDVYYNPDYDHLTIQYASDNRFKVEIEEVSTINSIVEDTFNYEN